MTATATPTAGHRPSSLDAGTLHRPQHLARSSPAAIVVGAASWLVEGTSPNWARWVIVTLIVYCVGIYVVSRIVEGPRHAVDRLTTAIMTSAFCLVLLPLVSVIWTVVQRGLGPHGLDVLHRRRCAASSARAAAPGTPSSAPSSSPP